MSTGRDNCKKGYGDKNIYVNVEMVSGEINK
jgi:hypothetical protein